MKHMSHLIEKQLQLVDDSDRSFAVTLIQRRNKVRVRRGKAKGGGGCVDATVR